MNPEQQQVPAEQVAYLHGIRVVFVPEAIASPSNLPALAAELARTYGTRPVEGYYWPMIHVLAPGPDLYGEHALARVAVTTALRHVTPITDTAEAIRLLRTQDPWLPPVAP
jgi:hypothetical protein